jgi:hypothetical protein
MGDSILNSVKKIIGIDAADTSFDIDIIIHINSVFNALTQIGVGPDEGFSITDATSKWEDFLEDSIKLELVKSYVALKVRKIFDPPQSSTAMEALNAVINELEWRIGITVDTWNGL